MGIAMIYNSPCHFQYAFFAQWVLGVTSYGEKKVVVFFRLKISKSKFYCQWMYSQTF